MYGLVDSWQRTALETYRIIAGEDSPAFRIWSEALDPHGGCWVEGMPQLNFAERWAAAGLSAPLAIPLSTICQPELQ